MVCIVATNVADFSLWGYLAIPTFLFIVSEFTWDHMFT